MPQLTINGKTCFFEKGETILQAALRHDEEIPHYCYHPGLSIVANCRICLAEVWSPDPKTGALRAGNKLFPTCQTPAVEGQVVYTDSPKAVGNQKAIMEFLLINHPVDCPVCDQAGECHLQDYSYQYGRGESRFKEAKNKRPKKDVGPHVLLYSDRCIMCTRCVRFTREVTGTGELLVDGRGSSEEIDVFPGIALDNELSGNVVDICPVGALLDKDFLFQQRVWFLKKTPSIDGITASGDNISVEHNEGVIYRVKPRDNIEVNKWWITDEVRYGWKFVHSENRLKLPAIKGRAAFVADDAAVAWSDALSATMNTLESAAKNGGRLGLMVSPMLTCEDAYLLATTILSIDAQAELAVGPIPVLGQDKTFPGGFTMYAEKAPNARGVRRVLEALAKGRKVHDAASFESAAKSKAIAAAVVTGNYPSEWVLPSLHSALSNVKLIVIDTMPSALTDKAEVVLPGATWTEKAGTFENAKNRLQGFERAISTVDFAKGESQIALDLQAARAGVKSKAFDAATTRVDMARVAGLERFTTDLHAPPKPAKVAGDMVLIEI
ncbi:MAG: ferredoxin [Phycisphaerales bacterium]|nr:ferredoxin [Phycisphaerales bacterium]